MAQTAVHLVDHVIPRVPVRQWVLALPIPLRLLLAAQPKLVTPVLQVVHRVITRFLLDQAGLKAEQADGGAVTLIQRFGSAADLNIHLHCLVLDGMYRRSADGAPVFVEVPALTDEALQRVLLKIITRLMRLLTRKGVLVEEQGQTYMADDDDSDDARVLRPLQAAACTYRIAFSPRAGQKVLTVQGAMLRDADFKQPLCADIDGFSLHAAVRCGADNRQGLEQLRRYITRPALANERVQINAAGQVVLKLKTAWRDSTTHSAPVTAGVHAAAGGVGATPQAAPDPFGVRVTSLREVSRPPLRELRRTGPQRQAAGAGGAAVTRAAHACRSACRVRGGLSTSPPGAAELGQAAQAGLSHDIT